MTDIVVMGAGGTLGQALMRVGRAKGLNIQGYTRTECDITYPHDVDNIASKYPAAICINAAGVTWDAVYDPYEFADAEYMLEVNTFGPRLLTYYFSKVVQVSTDCVFDGKGPDAYDEDSLPAPRDYYGLTKLGGELEHERHVTIRTSFIGFGQRGFLKRMILDQPQGARIQGYSNWLWNGMYVDVAAELILKIALENHMQGLYHLEGKTLSKAELLQRITQHIRRDIKVEVVSHPEPRRMILESVRHHPVVPSWDEQIERMANDYRLHSGRPSRVE